MADGFISSALPLDQEGFEEVLDDLGVGAAELWAVLRIETHGCGFLADRRPDILYERHVFSRLTDRRYDQGYPSISNKKAGGYGAGGANQYNRLNLAMSLDRTAALKSASWGIGQLMGFNAEIAGYVDVNSMVEEMVKSESHQLKGMAGEMKHGKLNRALMNHDWARFARGYNGAGYAANSYDIKLKAAYQKYAHGPLPDLIVRAAQMFLTYLGYAPGPVDGWMGKRTRSALNEFQEKQGLELTTAVDQEHVDILKAEVQKLP